MPSGIYPGQRAPRPHRRKFDHEAAIERFKAGKSLFEIAHDFGVRVQAVDQMLKKRGIKF